MVGAGLSWNLWDWHKTHREKAILKLQQNIIETNLDQFNRSLKMSLKQEENNSQKLKELINTDEQLVTIKDQISKRSATALENGAITSADYIRDLNALLQAKANLETRKVQLVQTSINYQTIKGEPTINK
jgi:outer membrane protein TolC